MIRSMYLVLQCFVILWFEVGISMAQVPTGIPAFGTYDADGLVTINLAYLNAHVEVPLRSSNARNLAFPLFLSMEDAFQVQGSSPDITYVPSPYFSLQSSIAERLNYNISTATCNNKHEETYNISGVTDGHNTSHPLGFIDPPFSISQYGCANPSSGSGTTGDGWFISASVSTSGKLTASVIDPEGRVHVPGVTLTDPNGNVATINSSTGAYIDASGNTILTQSGPLSSQTFTYTGPGGSQETYTETSTTYTIGTNFGCPGETTYSYSGQPLVTKLTRPDGSFYALTYEPSPGLSGAVTGRLASVTLPTGGVITYSYFGGANGINCSDGSTAGFTKTTPDGRWTYTHSTSNGYGTTTVTAPSGEYIVYNFAGLNEVQRQAYTSSGILLGKTLTCYNGNFSNCSTSNLVVTPISQKDVYTYPGTSSSPSLVETKFNLLGSPTQITNYDFGTAIPPSSNFVSRTTINYGSWSGSSCQFNTNGTLPCNSITVDGSGATKQAQYNNYDVKGNLLTEKDLVGGSTYLSKQFTYYPTGLVNVATDVNGAQTTYTNGACNSSFPTSVSEPLSLSKSMTWDCNGEVLTSATDENSQTTQYGYLNQQSVADPFWRVLSTKDPLNNTIWNIYSGSSLPATQESVLLFNSNASTVDNLTTLDGLGRPTISQKRQGPGSSNFDTTSTTYDSDGRVAAVTMPCVKAASLPCPAAPATTTTYDGLSRPLVVTDGGGGTTSYTYTLNDVLQAVGPAPTGENTKSRQMEYDGLGRLTSVCEVTTATGYTACGQNSPQNGYRTNYSYDALGNITAVTQNAKGSPQETRGYTFDGLSRLTSENNPETGVTNYIYDSANTGVCVVNNPGDLVMKTNAATGVSSCSVYDALHRVLSIGHNPAEASGSPDRYFVYDAATVNGVPMAYTKGRLAEAYTCTSAAPCTKVTDLGFVYSQRGENLETWESTLHSGGYYHPTAGSGYWANGGLQTLWMSGLPTISYGADGEGRTSTVTASSGQNPVPNVPSYNAASQVTGVTFGSGDGDVLTFDPNTGRMTQYKFNVSGSAQIGNLGWNANSTLKTLGITDPFNAGDAQNCSYAYDDLSRLASAGCGSVWAQSFNYDAFGNTTKSGSSSWMPLYNTKNQYQSIPGFSNPGPTYDANGDVLTDSFHTYTWDADGHVSGIDSVGLTYDALGRQIEQNQNGTYFQIVYSPMGSKLAVMKGQTIQQAFVPLPGGTTAEYLSWGLSHYRHPDWLGSERLESSTTHAILQDTAYAPFGEPHAELSGGNGEISFTGQNKDTDWLNYDFMYREYDPRQSRWISPDPSGMAAVDPSNPQSWNRYVYVLNNPLGNFDPLGLQCVWDDGSYDSATDPNTGNIASCVGAGGKYFDPSTFSAPNGDWSDQPNQDLANQAAAQPQFTFQTQSLAFGPMTLSIGLNLAANNNRSQAPRICGGTFEFGGLEADLVEAGAFTGVIHEHDSIDGNSVGNLTEIWGGGEVVAAGGGKITSPTDKSVLRGFLGFVGLGANAGPLAGLQIGYATGKGWGGLYIEGHLGPFALGAGGYLRTSCKAGG